MNLYPLVKFGELLMNEKESRVEQRGYFLVWLALNNEKKTGLAAGGGALGWVNVLLDGFFL
jgi:hypothetical protein